MITCVGLHPAVDRVVEAPGFGPGRHVDARLVVRQAAGKAANLARTLGLLGCPAQLMGFVGSEELEFYRSGFAGLPVDVRLTPVDAPTRENMTVLDPTDGRDMHLRETGAPVGQADLARLAAQVRERAAGSDWVVFSGSLPPGVSPEDLAGLVREVACSDLRVAADLSGEALRVVARHGVALLKPNRQELGELVGRELEGLEALRGAAVDALRSGAAKELLVSDGAAGAGLFTQKGGWWAHSPPPGPVCNTVGAGDTLLAGFLAARVRGEAPDRCLARAVAAAASAVAQVRAGTVDPQAVRAAEARVEPVAPSE